MLKHITLEELNTRNPQLGVTFDTKFAALKELSKRNYKLSNGNQQRYVQTDTNKIAYLTPIVDKCNENSQDGLLETNSLGSIQETIIMNDRYKRKEGIFQIKAWLVNYYDPSLLPPKRLTRGYAR